MKILCCFRKSLLALRSVKHNYGMREAWQGYEYNALRANTSGCHSTFIYECWEEIDFPHFLEVMSGYVCPVRYTLWIPLMSLLSKYNSSSQSSLRHAMKKGDEFILLFLSAYISKIHEGNQHLPRAYQVADSHPLSVYTPFLQYSDDLYFAVEKIAQRDYAIQLRVGRAWISAKFLLELKTLGYQHYNQKNIILKHFGIVIANICAVNTCQILS